jgi:hypothetical protein
MGDGEVYAKDDTLERKVQESRRCCCHSEDAGGDVPRLARLLFTCALGCGATLGVYSSWEAVTYTRIYGGASVVASVVVLG